MQVGGARGVGGRGKGCRWAGQGVQVGGARGAGGRGKGADGRGEGHHDVGGEVGCRHLGVVELSFYFHLVKPTIVSGDPV